MEVMFKQRAKCMSLLIRFLMISIVLMIKLNKTLIYLMSLSLISLCCQCGTAIEPNPSNTCVACLRTQVDITEGIPKQVVIYFCKGCERYELSIHSIDYQILRKILLFINRYQQQIGQWIVAALESRELLSLCLKKLKALNRVNNNLIF
jgi:nonsense-mediated mRNA decay protein 3